MGGAIGAALAGAAEFGRETGGFRTLTEIPERLRGGRLEALFQAQPSTEPLLRVMLEGPEQQLVDQLCDDICGVVEDSLGDR